MTKPVERIAVIGAGTMGAGIAQVAAVAGFGVRLTDADAKAAPRALERIRTTLAGGVSRGKITSDHAEAALGRIAAVSTQDEAARDAQLIIEAIVEDLEIKRRLFADLDRMAPGDAILATNTSSLSVARIAQATRRPSRVVGMHFFNPVHIMELVELVQHAGTEPDVIDSVRKVVVAMKKTPILVRDTPGFASARLGVALGLEAMRMVEEGVAAAADIDTAMALGYGHPMGPLRVTDLVGLDVRLRIAEYLHQELGGSRFEPPAILRQKVAAGELGKKSGKGFYDWPTDRA
jgi:3-hydroxybutyryl-CoA dehydrogenase